MQTIEKFLDRAWWFALALLTTGIVGGCADAVAGGNTKSRSLAEREQDAAKWVVKLLRMPAAVDTVDTLFHALHVSTAKGGIYREKTIQDMAVYSLLAPVNTQHRSDRSALVTLSEDGVGLGGGVIEHNDSRCEFSAYFIAEQNGVITRVAGGISFTDSGSGNSFQWVYPRNGENNAASPQVVGVVGKLFGSASPITTISGLEEAIRQLGTARLTRDDFLKIMSGNVRPDELGKATCYVEIDPNLLVVFATEDKTGQEGLAIKVQFDSHGVYSRVETVWTLGAEMERRKQRSEEGQSGMIRGHR